MIHLDDIGHFQYPLHKVFNATAKNLSSSKPLRFMASGKPRVSQQANIDLTPGKSRDICLTEAQKKNSLVYVIIQFQTHWPHESKYLTYMLWGICTSMCVKPFLLHVLWNKCMCISVTSECGHHMGFGFFFTTTRRRKATWETTAARFHQRPGFHHQRQTLSVKWKTRDDKLRHEWLLYADVFDVMQWFGFDDVSGKAYVIIDYTRMQGDLKKTN